MEQSLVQELGQLGLSETESRVYIAALELGGGVGSAIASASGVERTNCYHTLKMLGQRGLMSVTNQGAFKFYVPETPKKILAEQADRFELAKKLIPALLSLENTAPGHVPRMKYDEGRAEVEGLLFQSAETLGETLSYTNLKLFLAKFSHLFPELLRRKAEKSLPWRIISSHHRETENVLERYVSKDYIRRAVQLLFVNPREFFLENEVTIFDNRVSIISLNPQEDLGVLIESGVFANTSRTIFNLSWLGATSFVAQ